MMPTLFEAIRQLKPGQAIEQTAQGQAGLVAEWRHGDKPKLLVFDRLELAYPVTIVNLMEPPQTLYKVLVEGAEKLDLNMNDDDPCMVCKYSQLTCRDEITDCRVAIIDTLQDIALEKGFDLKAIVAKGETK